MGIFDDLRDALGDEETAGKPQFFSSGPDPVTIKSTEWRKFTFGFAAGTVVVRADVDILVAFERPYDFPGRHVKFAAHELPADVSGESPINADTMWAKVAESAATDEAGVEITAQPQR